MAAFAESKAELEAACEQFLLRGCLLLPGLYAPDFVAQLAAAYALGPPRVAGRSRWNVGIAVGDGRRITTLPLSGPFAAAAFFAPPALCLLLSALLGRDFVLSSCSVVRAEPGAAAQRVHRDVNLLYGNRPVSLRMPPFALTVALPLVALTPATGTTALYAGSQLEILPERALARTPDLPYTRLGDAYLFDCRLFHGGTANASAAVRPIVYLTFVRAWFSDHENLLEMLIADETALAAVPPAWPGLLRRARGMQDASLRLT